MRSELERVEIPGEHDARERTWAVVSAAFAERQPMHRSEHRLRLALAVAVAVGVIAAALSPPGRAVIDEIREAVGVQRAQPALFSLPSSGNLLVASDAGVWLVREDGSKRLLGAYREASWSPFGRYIAAVRKNELAALEPNGDVRWTLARPGVGSPRWTGTEADTRIAYLSGSTVRVVAGDGTGDRKACAAAVAQVAPAWRPGASFELAVAARDGSIRIYGIEKCRLLGRSRSLGDVRSLEWSSDGQLLLVRARRSLSVLDARGHVLHPLLGPGAAPVQAAALRPGGHAVAFVQAAAGRSQLWVIPHLRPDGSAARRIFAGAGRFDGLAWSPDGRWMLVTWPVAEQWVFVRTDGRGIRAASSISEQFRSSSFPRTEGWCCVP